MEKARDVERDKRREEKEQRRSALKQARKAERREQQNKRHARRAAERHPASPAKDDRVALGARLTDLPLLPTTDGRDRCAKKVFGIIPFDFLTSPKKPVEIKVVSIDGASPLTEEAVQSIIDQHYSSK